MGQYGDEEYDEYEYDDDECEEGEGEGSIPKRILKKTYDGPQLSMEDALFQVFLLKCI